MKTIKQNNQSLYGEKQCINSILPTAVSKSLLNSLPTVNKSHISELAAAVPIHSNSIQHGTVPLSESPNTAQYVIVPKVAFTTFDHTDVVQYGTSSNQDLLTVTIPIRLKYVQFDTSNSVPPCEIVSPSFVQGLYMPKRNDSCLRNKYTKKIKLSRTPLIVPSIIDHSKDDNPHLDQDNILTVITMDLEVAPLVVFEPVPGLPEITRTGVCSYSSPIKHHHLKLTHVKGGEEESYRFSAGVH